MEEVRMMQEEKRQLALTAFQAFLNTPLELLLQRQQFNSPAFHTSLCKYFSLKTENILVTRQ